MERDCANCDYSPSTFGCCCDNDETPLNAPDNTTLLWGGKALGEMLEESAKRQEGEH